MPNEKHGLAKQAVRLLYVHHGGDWIRGSEVCLLTLLRSQVKRGCVCAVAANSPVLLDAAGKIGAKTVRLSSTLSNEYFPRLRMVLEANDLLKDFRPTVVHLNSPEYVKCFLPACVWTGAVSVYHAHCIQPPSEHRWNWSVLAGRIVGCGDLAAQAYADHGLAPNRVMAIRNGIETRRVGPRNQESATQLLGARPGTHTLICVGSLIDRKRPTDVIRALSDVANVDLVFVGSGEREGDLKLMVKRLGLTGRVRFLGDRTDVPDLLAQADAFVAPSGWEALPLAVIEAASVGLPVIASDIGPHKEILGAYGRSRRYPVGDIAALASAVRSVVDTETGAAWESVDAQMIRDAYSIERFVWEFTALYDKLGASTGRWSFSRFPDLSQVTALFRRRHTIDRVQDA